MGMTFANFILFGKTPVLIIWYIIRVRGLMIDGAIHLSKLVDIPSIPTLILFVKSEVIVSLKAGHIVSIHKDNKIRIGLFATLQLNSTYIHTKHRKLFPVLKCSNTM